MNLKSPYKPYISPTVFWLSCVCITSFYPQITASSQGAFVVSQIRDSIYNLKEAAQEVKQQTKNVTTVLSDISQLNATKKKIKETAGVSSIETQIKTAQDTLDQSTAALYTKAFGQGEINRFNQIYSVLKEIFNDPIIKENVNGIIFLQQSMTQRILLSPNQTDYWAKQIQNAGQKISVLAAEQIKTTDSILAQIKTAKSQALSSGSSSDAKSPLNQLQQLLSLKQIELQKALNDLPVSTKKQIKDKQDIIQKNNFLMQYIEDPRKAAWANPDIIATQESDSAFATE